MLVKVSRSFCGIYGHYDLETASVASKTNKSAPFEEDDALCLRFIEKGILEKAGTGALEPEKEPVANAEATAESADAEEDEERALEDMGMEEVKAIAASYGIAYKVGMSKAKLIEAVRDAEADVEPPELATAMPE